MRPIRARRTVPQSTLPPGRGDSPPSAAKRRPIAIRRETSRPACAARFFREQLRSTSRWRIDRAAFPEICCEIIDATSIPKRSHFGFNVNGPTTSISRRNVGSRRPQVTPRSGDALGIERHSRGSSEETDDPLELVVGSKMDDQPATSFPLSRMSTLVPRILAKLLLQGRECGC